MKFQKYNNPNPSEWKRINRGISSNKKNLCLKCQMVECPKGRTDDDQRSSKNDNFVKGIE